MRMTSRRGLRLAVPLVLAGGAVGVLSLTGSATAGNGNQHLTIVAKGRGASLHYKVRGKVNSIERGGILRIKNRTNEPHTFSLVKKSARPTTRLAQRNCFHKRHICRKIAAWHGVKGNGPPTINPVDVGRKGWDTKGGLHSKGDSVFYLPPKNPKAAKVSANARTTLYFMCAIHPWMHGKIRVVG